MFNTSRTDGQILLFVREYEEVVRAEFARELEKENYRLSKILNEVMETLEQNSSDKAKLLNIESLIYDKTE